MATTLVDLVIEVRRPRIGKRLDPITRKGLSEKIIIEPTKVKVEIPNITAKEFEALTPEIPEITTDELIDQYDELGEKAKGLRELVVKRLKNHTLFMKIDPLKDPTNFSYMKKLFKGNAIGISFQMYLKLLEYRDQLGAALVEAE